MPSINADTTYRSCDLWAHISVDIWRWWLIYRAIILVIILTFNMAVQLFNNSIVLLDSTGEGHPGYDVIGDYPGPEMPDVNHDPLYEDMRNHTYPVPIIPKPTWEVGVKAAFYVPLILVALLGNVAVIVTVWRNKRMWTTTNFYIVNLAVSDLLITLSCTWVHLVDHLTEGWVLGAFFCKFNSFAQGKLNSASTRWWAHFGPASWTGSTSTQHWGNVSCRIVTF